MHKHSSAPGSTSSQWKRGGEKKKNTTPKNSKYSVYDAFSKRQAQQIAKLWPFLRSSSSPRPPRAALCTTCIYKQHKGLTAVCRGRRPVFSFEWNLMRLSHISSLLHSALNISIRLPSPTISPSVKKHIQQTCWQAFSQWLWATQRAAGCWGSSAAASQPLSLGRPQTHPGPTNTNPHAQEKRPWSETFMSAKIS